MKPSDSSSGVDCALPTTKSPARSTMKVSVIVPPASIASTRGSRSSLTARRLRADGLRAHDVRVDDHVVQRAVGLVPQRPEVVEQDGDAEHEAAGDPEDQLAHHQLAQQGPAELDGAVVVADDADAQRLLAQGLAVALAGAGHQERRVEPPDQRWAGEDDH